MVEKKELLNRVWEDAFVEEGSLTRTISILRKVLKAGDDGCVDGIMKLWKPAVVVRATLQLGYAKSAILGIGVTLLACTPIPRIDGIEPSSDPLLELRAAIYLLSGRRRCQASESQVAASQTA